MKFTFIIIIIAKIIFAHIIIFIHIIIVIFIIVVVIINICFPIIFIINYSDSFIAFNLEGYLIHSITISFEGINFYR
jgi:hypothetical protein